LFRPTKTTTTRTVLSRKNIVILIVIAIVASLLAVYSNQYYTTTSAKIADIASHEKRTSTQIQAHDISQILTNRIESVTALLQTLTDSPAIHNNEYQRAYVIINNRQHYSAQFTDFYMWLDKNGKLNWVSDMNQTAYQRYKGTDLSYRQYFTIPKNTLSVYYSTLIESNDKVPRLYIAYPVINKTEGSNSKGVFTGIVAASINVNTLGNALKNELFPQFNSTLGVLDKNGIILYANPSSFIGKHVFGTEMQSAFSSMLSPQTKNSFNGLLRDSLSGNAGSVDIFAQGKMNTIAYEPVKVNGKYFLTLFISAPHDLASDVNVLIDQQKNFSVVIVIVIGIIAFGIAFLVLLWNRKLENTVNIRTSELKTANEQLKVHDKMQREFINVASHEMKTPTQAILGYTDILQKHPEKGEQIFEALHRNANRLQRLTNDILDVTRIESQTLKLIKEKFNLSELISSIADDFKNNIQKKGSNAKLLYEPEDSLRVEADKERITQVISNLLSNAIKFTKEGRISINVVKKRRSEVGEDCGQEEEVAVISVKDTGVGIDPEILPRLFTKFATKSDMGGTGLGLFISKYIVESHGGKMWAENNNNNINNGQERGATFYFSLPLMTNNENMQLKDSNENANTATTSK
jgi:signal transduction histidine kinase